MIFSKLQLIAGMMMITGLTAAASGEAQQDSSGRAAQVTFVTPLGTNWTRAGSYTNSFSLNLLVGYNGGRNGAEFSGLAERVPAGKDSRVLTAAEAIPFGFKIALEDIARNAIIRKYGETIGTAGTLIPKGTLVHIHNLEGTRARGDLEKGGTS